MKRLMNSCQLLLVLVLGVSLTGCVTTHVPMATASPWQAMDLDTQANPLDVAFTDSRHGYRAAAPDDPGNQRRGRPLE